MRVFPVCPAAVMTNGPMFSSPMRPPWPTGASSSSNRAAFKPNLEACLFFCPCWFAAGSRIWSIRPAIPAPRSEESRVGSDWSSDVCSSDLLLQPRRFQTQLGGLFVFLPLLVRCRFPDLVHQAGYPGTKMIPAAQALLSTLALKLTSTELDKRRVGKECRSRWWPYHRRK